MPDGSITHHHPSIGVLEAAKWVPESSIAVSRAAAASL
jgi:hypothetical protein